MAGEGGGGYSNELKYLIKALYLDKRDRYRESIWNWFGLLSRKQLRRVIYNNDL